MTFIIDDKGRLRDAGIYHKKPCQYTAAEKKAIKVLYLMPRWKPGKLNGKAVYVKYFWPVTIDYSEN